MRTVKYRKGHYGGLTAWDHVGILARIVYSEWRKEYYVHMINGIGYSHYEKSLKDAKKYLECL